MSDIPILALALVAGALLGTLFFGGLWWTVQKGVTSERPALWFFGSMLLRTGIILAGFYFVSQGDWTRLAACVLGFLIARVVVVKWLTRAPTAVRALHSDSANDVRLESLTYEEEARSAP